jgi:micrococcal nuclease
MPQRPIPRVARKKLGWERKRLNQGAFEMVAPVYGSHDKYGRDLRTVQRRLPDGSLQSIAEDMRTTGLAHRYTGFKTAWC